MFRRTSASCRCNIEGLIQSKGRECHSTMVLYSRIVHCFLSQVLSLLLPSRIISSHCLIHSALRKVFFASFPLPGLIHFSCQALTHCLLLSWRVTHRERDHVFTGSIQCRVNTHYSLTVRLKRSPVRVCVSVSVSVCEFEL